MGLFDAIARYMPADEEDTPVGTAGMFSGPSKAEVQGATNAVQDWWQWRDKRGWVPSVEDVTMGLAPMGMAAPIKAWHGSPHDFNAFSLEKIGTGEGAQAYGHGLYFAGSRGTAEHYREALSGGAAFDKIDGFLRENKGRALGPDEVAEGLRAAGLSRVANEPTAVDAVRNLLPSYDPASAVTGDTLRHYRSVNDAVERLENGRLYEVELRPEEHQLLDWDKPLAEQPEGVRQALEPFVSARREVMSSRKGIYTRPVDDILASQKGDAWYEDIASLKGGSYPAASQALYDAGIPGLRYLDGGSRNAQQWSMLSPSETVSGKWRVSQFGGANGRNFDTEAAARAFLDEQNGALSHNYVMFNDADIQILRKLGLLGAALGGGYAMGGGSNEAQAQPLGSYLIGQ